MDFAESYKQYWQEIYRYFYRVTLNSHIAEELTQDVFFKALRSFALFRRDAGVRTWLFKIANNTYISWMRKHKTLPAPNPDLVEATDFIGESHQRMMLEELFVKLSERDRQLITLRDMYGFTYQEVAGILNLSQDQVRVGLYRARKRSRKLLSEMGWEI